MMNMKYVMSGVSVWAMLTAACASTSKSDAPAGEMKESPGPASQGSDSQGPGSMGAATQAAADSASKNASIVDVAMADGSFSTLVTALKAANLVDTLQGDGPFTVFAPTDEAFAKLPDGTIESLLKDTDKLGKILTFHVVSGKAMAADVSGMSSVTTLNGQDLSIDASDGVRVGKATVVKADVAAKNGVIHVIDTVLLPTE